jgi:hypothetical protein
VELFGSAKGEFGSEPRKSWNGRELGRLERLIVAQIIPGKSDLRGL